MAKFNEVRDQLPMDGSSKVVEFERIGRDESVGKVKRFARPKRRTA